MKSIKAAYNSVIEKSPLSFHAKIISKPFPEASMLDKSIPYKNIIMRRPAERIEVVRSTCLSAPSLPSGFTFRLYSPGDARNWSVIETSVLEFDNVQAAEKYFGQDFLPYEEELKRRMVFVVNDKGEYVATATAWRNDFRGRHQASLHWVSVRPEFQGLGLGGAVVLKALSLFPQAEPGLDVYLHTQTWSHKAVRLYAKLGFHICRTDTLGHKNNDYVEAMGILKKVLSEPAYKTLEREAVD